MKVSIITVSYNSCNTIEDTFNSIRNQTYTDIEYLVIDGQSTDNTINIINDNADIISSLIVEKDNGIYEAMNKGIQIANGDIVGILNSDDIYYADNVISLVVKAFNDNETDVVYGDIQYVSKNLKKVIRNWRSSSFKKGMFKMGWQPPHPAFFVKKKVYEKISGFNLEYNISADFDFMHRVLEINNFKSKYIRKILTKMRVGGASNNSLKNIFMGNKQILLSFKTNKVKINPVIFFIRRFYLKIIQYCKK